MCANILLIARINFLFMYLFFPSPATRNLSTRVIYQNAEKGVCHTSRFHPRTYSVNVGTTLSTVQ